MSEQNRNYEQIEEIILHFGKGTVEPFTAEDGRDMLKIMIPNADRSDHTPWASFVLPAKAVHENQYGKGLWANIPADGHTTLTKPYLAGQSEDGKNIWKDEKTTVSNRELKSLFSRDFTTKSSRGTIQYQLFLNFGSYPSSCPSPSQDTNSNPFFSLHCFTSYSRLSSKSSTTG